MRPASLLAIAFLPLAGALLLSSCGSESFCVEARTCEDEGDGGSSSGGGGSDLGGGGSGAGTGGSGDPCDACSGETPLCNADGECVACLEATDCTDPNASACGDDGACGACQTHADCAHLTGTNVCDDGTCVECTVATEAEACGDNSCNPATKTCTETARSSVTVCETCVADSECENGYACVPMTFNGAPREGGYCLKVFPGCAGPYGVPTQPRSSLSGAEAVQYCGINEAVTTCEAVLDLVTGTLCSEPTDCGAPGLSDARCEIVNGGLMTTCTLGCSGSVDCNASAACGGPSDSKYCGG